MVKHILTCLVICREEVVKELRNSVVRYVLHFDYSKKNKFNFLYKYGKLIYIFNVSYGGYMKKLYIKISIIVIIGFLCLVIIGGIKFFNLLFPVPISEQRMEKEFIQHKELLIDIASYFVKQKYDSIYITTNSKKGEMFVSNNEEMGKTIKITDNEIVEKITDLFEKYHYNVLIRDHNGIYFQRYSNRDYGRGVVYSTDGETLQNEFLTIVEPLTCENWYFYEEK